MTTINYTRLLAVGLGLVVCCVCNGEDNRTTNISIPPGVCEIEAVGDGFCKGQTVVLTNRVVITNGVARESAVLLFVTANEVTAISATNIQVKLKSKERNFQITLSTKFCADGQNVTWDSFKVGDRATIVSGVEIVPGVETVSDAAATSAFSVRKGLFREVYTFGSRTTRRVMDYDCQ